MMRKSLSACLLFVLSITQNAFAQAPMISSFAPASGPVSSTTLTIAGNNFNAVANNNIVYFGAVTGTVTAASPTSLSVLVPPGALFEPFSVLNTANNLQGYSDVPFGVTFPSIYNIDNTDFDPRVDITTSGTSSNPNSVAVGDFDGDGKNDIVVTQTDNTLVTILKNNTTFGNIFSYSFYTAATITAGYNSSVVRVADIDGDGKPDIALFYPNVTAGITILRNTSTVGNISFAAPVDFTTTYSSSGEEAMIIADLDNDGKPDVVISTQLPYPNGAGISIFKNTSTAGNVSFSVQPAFASGVQGIYGMATADMDGDGKPDICGTSPLEGLICIIKNTSSGGNLSFTNSANVTNAQGGYYIATGDLDGDGKPDIVSCSPNTSMASIFRNTSAAGILSFSTATDFPGGGDFSDYVAINDFDGDGKNDFIITNANGHNLSIFRNTSVVGVLNSSSFVNAASLPLPTIWCGVTGDLDNDGKPDIITCSDYNVVSIYRNDPPPIITPPEPAVCSGDSIILSITPAASYQWQADTSTGFFSLTNSIIYNGVNTDSLTIMNTADSMNNYIFRCMVVNSGITKYSKSDTLVVHSLPVPVIINNNSYLATGAFNTYQWLLNNAAINGATSQHFTPVIDGSYRVYVTNAFGCSDTSAALALSDVAVKNIHSPDLITIHPNPASDVITLDNAPENLNLSIKDLNGREIMCVKNAHTVNIERLNPGVYMLCISDEYGTILKIEKLVKTGN